MLAEKTLPGVWQSWPGRSRPTGRVQQACGAGTLESDALGVGSQELAEPCDVRPPERMHRMSRTGGVD